MPEQQKTPWPQPAFHFKVNLHGHEGHFQQVDGLKADDEKLEYRNSLSPKFGVLKTQDLKNFTEINLKKGVFKGQGAHPDFFVASHNPTTFDVSILLLDEFDTALILWTLTNAYFKHVKTGNIDFQTNDMYVEEMQLAGEALTMKAL